MNGHAIAGALTQTRADNDISVHLQADSGTPISTDSPIPHRSSCMDSAATEGVPERRNMETLSSQSSTSGLRRTQRIASEANAANRYPTQSFLSTFPPQLWQISLW